MYSIIVAGPRKAIKVPTTTSCFGLGGTTGPFDAGWSDDKGRERFEQPSVAGIMDSSLFSDFLETCEQGGGSIVHTALPHGLLTVDHAGCKAARDAARDPKSASRPEIAKFCVRCSSLAAPICKVTMGLLDCYYVDNHAVHEWHAQPLLRPSN